MNILYSYNEFSYIYYQKPQTQGTLNGLTVGELVSYGRYPYQNGFGRIAKKDKERIDWALHVTGTKEYKYRTVDALS